MVYLYDKLGKTNLGALDDIISCFVTEERNGMFELELEYPNGYPLSDNLQIENIIICNANDTLKSQKFRIYDTQKLMDNTIVVFARHISFDLMYDYIDSLSFENQSCEYALNQLFRKSNFSTHYKGYSDIINAQDYSVSMSNILEAIGGKSGSIIDTFGTGAEILRDNENIHVLNKRGYNNDVTIEYRKNLTGFELEEDTTELITRILPYAIYTNEDNEEITVKADYVDSLLISNYSHPYIKHIDYSDRFDEDNTPNVSKLQTLAQNEYRDNKVDIPKQNFKIEFIPLSKCVGYEGLEDKISLCDIVTIKDARYNINTQAKVVKATFNVLKSRYESMELGEPKASLGDIIGGGGDSTVGPPGPQGPPGADGEAGDFPDTLPHVPIVETKVYGFSNIEISWTFENKVYYQYEVYASKEENFTPNTFNLIHQGQTSTYMYQAKPNETWYFKVCALNSHGNRTDFGSASATTVKIEDLSNYVEKMAISDALIGTLSLDRGWVGKLNANLLDVKGNLSVTDGNGARTLDVDSFGNVHIKASTFTLQGKDVITESELNSSVNEALSKQTSTDIFNKLTDNGVKQGLYMQNNQLYINGQYVNAKNLRVVNNEGKQTFYIDSYGDVNIDPSSVRIGFNGINDRININSRSMDFTAQNGNKDMLLYNGQVCVYNNMDDTFLSTVGAVLNNKNNFKGVGFLAGANCSNFVVGRDANWSDILTNREPTINYYLNIDFDNYKITTNSSLKCGSVDMSGSDLNNVYSGKIKDVYCYNIRDYNNGNYLFTSNGNDIKVGCDLIFNGNAIMNPTLYTNSFNYTNGFNAFSKSVYGNNMMNNTNWDWQGNNLVRAKIYDSYAGYSLIEECFKSNKDIENDINIKIACEDISSVDSDGDVSYKLDDMFKLLYSKIDKLEKEIEVLKKEGA